MVFEDEVRRTAEAIWGLQPGECQPAFYTGAKHLHELDGVARLPDLTHVLMVTTSTKLNKVKDDVKKLNEAETKELGKRMTPVRKWLVTEHTLDAQHLSHARRHRVEALTYAQFRRRFFNGRDYLTKRRGAAFGSARNLRDASVSIPDDEYVPLPMEVRHVLVLNRQEQEDGRSIDIGGLADLIREGSIVVLLGPFGAGKSLTTREIFRALAADRDVDARAPRVPLAINCREHWGAIHGDEILRRHADSIGFRPADNLTVAWRAGLVHLLLDGFDELAAQTISTVNRHYMRQARQEALTGVKNLVRDAPEGTGVLLCGRDHYFDDLRELAQGLGVSGREFCAVRIGEFTEEQAARFLEQRGKQALLPDWLPRKPLLLGYLAHHDLLDPVLQIDASRGFGFAWDSFLALVCEREADHSQPVMDPDTIRRVLEALASKVRTSSSGTRPITGIDLAQVYRSLTGAAAGEAVIMQLQRLPGLTPRERDPTARSFVDSDMLAALQGGAVARAVVEGKSPADHAEWSTGLTTDGVRMAAHMLRKDGCTAATVLTTAARMSKQAIPGVSNQYVADCAAIALELSAERREINCRGLEVTDSHFDAIDVEERAIVGLGIRNCIIDVVRVGDALKKSTVVFDGCVIERVEGVPAQEGLPEQTFRKCEIYGFDDASTNAAVLRLALPAGVKVLLTVLRKLYLQAGGGRKMSALKRGLPSDQMQRMVDKVVEALESEGIVGVSSEVVHPIRKCTTRVHGILAAGGLAEDTVVERVRGLR